MQSKAGRLSESTIAGFIGAAAFAVLTAGTAVAVSTTAVSITNPSTGVKAHVTAKQTLVTSDRDPYTGVYARVDSNGRQLVGEGVPTKTFSGFVNDHMDPGDDLESAFIQLPGTGATRLRMVSISVDVPSGQSVKVSVEFKDRSSGHPTYIHVPLVPLGTFAGKSEYAAALPVDIWPRAGSSLAIFVDRSATDGYANIRMDASGVAV